MTSRITFIAIIVVIVLCGALWLSVNYGLGMRRECTRLSSNQESLMEEIGVYKVRDSLSAASVKVLTLRTTEIDGHFSSLTKLINDMGLKMRRLESFSQNAVESKYEIRTPLRDTVVMTQPAQLLRYETSHISLYGVISGGEFSGKIVSRDTLTQIVHRIPRRFLFFRWGTRRLQQEIVSSNPHSKITYSRHVRITD